MTRKLQHRTVSIVRHFCNTRNAGVLLLVCSGLGAWAGLALAQATLVPRGDCGWRFIQPVGNFDVAAASLPSYNDTAWNSGCTPFWAPWACDKSGTAIPQEGQFFMRHHIFNSLPHVAYARYDIWAWGPVGGIYINGRESCGGGGTGACPLPNFTTLSCMFPLQPGDNAILFHYPIIGGTYPFSGQINAQITSDDLTPATGSTWGTLKLIYR